MPGKIRSRIEQFPSLESQIKKQGDSKRSSSRAWLKRVEEQKDNTSPEKQSDSLRFADPKEVPNCIEAENRVKNKLERIIRQGRAEDLNVTVDLKLEDLHVFRKGSVYVICKDRSVAEKHLLGSGVIEQVTFTDVNKILGGGEYRIDIDPAQFSAFQKGSDVHITPNEKFADENQGWRLMSKGELDLSQYFAKRTSDSETDRKEHKTIIDLSGPPWDKYRKIVREDGVEAAFEQFLSDVGGEDTKKLLDDLKEIKEAFGEELSKDGNITYEYDKAYDKYVNDYLSKFEEKLNFGRVDEDKMSSIIKNAENALKKMREALLEKGFNLFIAGEGAEIGKLYKERRDIFDRCPKEAQKAIRRRDYHYQDFEVSRDEFLVHHFKPKEEGTLEGEDQDRREQLIESMKKKLEKSKRLCEWEAALDGREIKGGFKKLSSDGENDEDKTDEQNRLFEQFMGSEDGKYTRRLLAEIDYLSNENFGEGKPLDEAKYQERKEKFSKAQRIFLNEYFGENGEINILETEQRTNVINKLNDNLLAMRENLYYEYYISILDKNTYEGKEIIKMQEIFGKLLQDQNLVSEPERLRKLQLRIGRRNEKRLFPARDEIVRASVRSKGQDTEDVQEYINEFENVLVDRIEIALEEIEIAKNPDKIMREQAKRFHNIIEDHKLPGKLEECLDGEQKDEIGNILKDIQDIDENIPYKLRDRAFRREYNGKITAFIDSIDRFKAPGNLDRDASAQDVYLKSSNLRKFLHEKMLGGFVKDYQGQDYVTFRDMYSRLMQPDALSGPGCTNVADTESDKMYRCHCYEFELLKAKNGEEIEDYFSIMAESAKESLEVAMREGEEEVDEAEESPPTEDKEKERIKNLKQILSDYQKRVRNVEQRRQREQDSMIKSYGDHLKATDYEELIRYPEFPWDQARMKNYLEAVEKLHNNIPKDLLEDPDFKSYYVNYIKKYMKNIAAFKDAKKKNEQIIMIKRAEEAKESIENIERFVSSKLYQSFEESAEGGEIGSLRKQHESISNRSSETPELETALEGSGFDRYRGSPYQPEFVLDYFAPGISDEKKSEIAGKRKAKLIKDLQTFIQMIDDRKDEISEEVKERAQESQEVLDTIGITV